MAARDVPPGSLTIPSTISFFEILARDEFSDGVFATDTNDDVFDARVSCVAGRGAPFGFFDFEWRVRAAIGPLRRQYSIRCRPKPTRR
jgi:hypothetical protein